MLQEITKLLQLQERDQRIRALQKELKDIPKHEALAKSQLAGDTAAVEAGSLRAKEIEVKIKGVELDIQTRQNTIKRLQDQQFETHASTDLSKWRQSFPRRCIAQTISLVHDHRATVLGQLDPSCFPDEREGHDERELVP